MRFIIPTVLFLISGSFLAQAQTRKTYKVAPGQSVSNALQAQHVLYVYPQFKEAQVAFKNGRFGSGFMNYNQLRNEMQYIAPAGDTLTLDNLAEVDHIAFGTDTFYHDETFLQLLERTPVTLAKHTELQFSNRQRLGGMGELNGASIASYSRISSGQGRKDVVPNEVLTFAEATTYFIGDRFNHFKPLNRKSLYNNFPKHHAKLETYMQNEPVNFLKEEDVLRLLAFLRTL